MAGSPSDRSSSAATEMLLVARFNAAEVTIMRQQVEVVAHDCGLDAEQTSDWVTAVNELMTNAVRHGGGTGLVRLWQDGALFCEVSDNGPGFPAEEYLGRADRPPVTAVGGIGLWIVQRMADSLSIDSGGAGTTARISVGLDDR